MSDKRSSMMATLADLKSKPETGPRRAAISNIESALERMEAHAARAPKGGGYGRTVTPHDREALMRIADDPNRLDAARLRAKAILGGGPDMSAGDAEFLGRINGKDHKGDQS